MDSLSSKVKEIYAAISGLPAMSELFSDPNLKLTWSEMLGGPYGGVYNSLGETLAGVFGRIGAEWDNFEFTPSGFHEADSAVTVEGTYTGVYKKTGKKVTARVIHLWKMSEGRILIEQFTDTAMFWTAME